LTAHTFGVGIASDKPPYILANAYARYVPEKGGIHPREASRFMASHAPRVLREALSQAGASMADIDAVAVALGPGLGPCLRTGATIARGLAAYYGKPLVPVNHIIAHIEIGRLATGLRDPLVLFVSGGNTMILAFNKGRYRVFGETLDISLGNLLDTFAREVGIAPPYVIEGLHQVDRCAEKGGRLLDLPYIVKGQDVSFSGLLTAALRAVKRGEELGDVCLTLREIAYSSVVEAAERGLAHTRKKSILLVGGVAASPPLREKVGVMAMERGGVEVGLTPPEYSGDNGAMIAWTGLLYYKHGVSISIEDATIRQRWRPEEAEVPWMAVED
jgi:N6-L-threonylcarbamoyladenine synthase